MTLVPGHRGSTKEVVTTCLGWVCSAVQIRLSPGSSHDPHVSAKCSYVLLPNRNASAREKISSIAAPASASKWAHPPRPNSPESPSAGLAPGHCITPSTETCVVVVKRMAGSSSRTLPRVGSCASASEGKATPPQDGGGARLSPPPLPRLSRRAEVILPGGAGRE